MPIGELERRNILRPARRVLVKRPVQFNADKGRRRFGDTLQRGE